MTPARCPFCDYSLQGLPVPHRCPECGGPYDERTQVWPARRGWWDPTLLFLVCLLAPQARSIAKVLSGSGLSTADWLILAANVLLALLMVRLYRGRRRGVVAITPTGIFVRSAGRPLLAPWGDVADVRLSPESQVRSKDTGNVAIERKSARTVGIHSHFDLASAERFRERALAARAAYLSAPSAAATVATPDPAR